MKKTLAFLLAMILALSLFTGTAAFAEETEPEEAAAAEEAVEETTDATVADTASEPVKSEKLSKSEIIAMSNYMNMNGVVKSGKWTVRWANQKTGIRLRSINRTAGESTIINTKGFPYYLIADGLNIIYLDQTPGTQNATIRRVRVSGGCDELLVDTAILGVKGFIQYLFAYDGHLYFSVNNESTVPATGIFYRSNLDGTDVTPILEKAAYYPYIIKDKLYYQDDADHARLHVCNLDGTDDQVFIDDFVYDYHTDGEVFYYNSFNGTVEWDENGKPLNLGELKRALKIFTPGEGIKVVPEVVPQLILFDGRTIYYPAMDDESRLYTYDTKTEKVDVLCFNDYVNNLTFYDENTLICVDANKSLNLENVFFMNINGSGITDAE